MKIKKRTKRLNWIEEESLQEKIGVSIGMASMCWKPTPTGVFQSHRAIEIGDELFDFIVDEVNEASCK